MPGFAKRINGLRVPQSNYHNSPMDNLAIDSRFIGRSFPLKFVPIDVDSIVAQVRGQLPHDGFIRRRSDEPVEDIVKGTVLSMLGTDFPLQWEHFCSYQQNLENDKGPVIFNILSKVSHNSIIASYHLSYRAFSSSPCPSRALSFGRNLQSLLQTCLRRLHFRPTFSVGF